MHFLHHDWLSLLIIPSRSSGVVYTAIQLQLGVATSRVKGPVATLIVSWGKAETKMLQWEGGEIGLSKEDQRRQEGGTDFQQEENRAHLTASVL